MRKLAEDLICNCGKPAGWATPYHGRDCRCIRWYGRWSTYVEDPRTGWVSARSKGVTHG